MSELPVKGLDPEEVQRDKQRGIQMAARNIQNATDMKTMIAEYIKANGVADAEVNAQQAPKIEISIAETHPEETCAAIVESLKGSTGIAYEWSCKRVPSLQDKGIVFISR